MDGTLSEPGAISYDLMYSRTGLRRDMLASMQELISFALLTARIWFNQHFA